MYKLYGFETNYFNDYLDFKNNIQQIKSDISIEIIDKIKAETSNKIDENGKKLYEIIGNEAHIDIKGQLRENKEICASLFGAKQTLYTDIRNSITEAENDNSVDKIILNIDSPGGTVNGVDLAAIAIKNANKFTEARIHNLGASAAYWLASQANKIIAMSPTVEIGSIGVVAEVIDKSEQDKERGIKRYSLTSADAPEKRPDISKKTGRDIIVNRLNDIHNVFVNRISEGRKVSIEKINKDFGKGGILIAEKALKAGMIDEIKNQINKDNIKLKNDKKKPPFVGGKNINKQGVNSMNLNELKTNHSDLYDQIKTEVLDSERKRVNSLLNWDQNEEVRKISRQAIIEGKTQDDVLAQLMTANNIDKKIKDLADENVNDINSTSSVDNDINADSKSNSLMPSREEILSGIGGI